MKRIFDLTLQGKTSKQIADLFNKEGIVTPAEYLKVRGLEKRVRKVWTRSIVARILNNPVYTGKCCRGKTQNISYKSKKRLYISRNERIITEDSHEAIVSQEIYDKIHNNNKYGMVLSETQKKRCQFLDYMYCGTCKEKMVRRKSRNYINVHCKFRNETELLCNNNSLYIYEEIEKLVIKNIKENFETYFKKNNISSGLVKKRYDKKIESIKRKLEDVNTRQGMIRFKISKLYNKRLDEQISEEEYKELYADILLKRNKVNQEKEDLENMLSDVKKSAEDLDKIKEIKFKLESSINDDFTDEEINQMIDKIEIYDDCIHIYYKFKNMSSNCISYHSVR